MTLSHLLAGWSAVTAVGWSIAAWIIVRGQRSMAFLSEIPPLPTPGPKVSIIIPARNEARHLERALRTILSLEYEPLEVCVVNDRSADGTGEILARLAREFPKLKTVAVRELPPGWLGKNHAAWRGAQHTSGELLLFTDADVTMEPTTVSRAVAYLKHQGLDHLAISPQITSPGTLLATLVGCFTLNFAFYAVPWKARNPRSSRFIGIGAFNLIRREIYQEIGTHAALAMDPIDDMHLGKRVKQEGHRQDMLFGREFLGIEWYASVRELVLGLEKNAFAGAFCRVEVVVAATLAALAFHVWPFLGVGWIPAPAGWYSLAAVGVIFGLSWDNARCHGHPRWSGVSFPLASLLLIYTVWRAMLVTLWRGGITWRGTFYPLDLIRSSVGRRGGGPHFQNWISRTGLLHHGSSAASDSPGKSSTTPSPE